ncbi:hypothetical protein AB0L47_36715 [Streptomyces bobili]|uniref:hypothetical protein n=1 Tax=Streptomyces bobili TaxID=67280 RepID=UPI003437CC9E
MRGDGPNFWGWTPQEWIHLLGRNQTEFHEHAPGWVNDEVRPHLAAHAYLLGSFNEFHRHGSFQRLTLSWRVFGGGLVTSEIARIRAVLASWGYQLGRDDDTLLPMVVCQLLLLNRSPHLEDLDTSLFDRVRREKMLAGSQRYTLHATQRAVAELGFCDPPQPITGRHSARATGGAKTWEQWVDRWYATSTLTPGVRGAMRSALLRVGRWIAAEQPDTADPRYWTRQTCATWIAAVDRMRVGDYVQRPAWETVSASRSKRRPRPGRSPRCGRFSGTARNGSGCPAALTHCARWRSLAASQPSSAPTHG